MSKLLAKYGTYEEELMGFDPNAIVAHAGGGQGSATALAFKWNTITTCASDYDSVKLIISKRGYQQVVTNNGAKILSIFPVVGEKINGVTNMRIDLQPGQIAAFECGVDGNWICYANSSQILLTTQLTLTANQIKNLFTSEVTLLPAPGAGYAIEGITGTVRYTAGGTPYAAGGQIQIKTATAGANKYQLLSSTVLAGTSFIERFQQPSIGSNMLENKGLNITCSTQNYTNGDGIVDIYASYRLITL